ncbi:hypothetical protein F511_30463 [Dorcoceras hygrometricum]|uniref:J domain-containing protein n=1 Tax=Dorcoceras hygrometricum TaxID=472368 RepID=A0A2Z7BLH3_9LAMI|nr:hypothetical protein F511_30463 [Dorcoceras hygrometricum]
MPILDMAYVTKFTALRPRLSDHRRLFAAILTENVFHCDKNDHDVLRTLLLTGKRWQTSGAEWEAKSEFAGRNAYDILRVSQTSSFSEIKASFRKLAKETHPDVALSQSHTSSASEKFIQILAAYEILSDPNKRAHYDHHLLSQRTFIERSSKRDPIIYNYNSYGNSGKNMEVVEWLKWYRRTINDILAERRVIAGSGYFDVLEKDFYSALHLAYYGPEIESLDLLPNCFEAEERSMHATTEVLHLVSGRDLFGMVCLANRCHELPHEHNVKLNSHTSSLVKSADDMGQQLQSDDDAYKDLQQQYVSIDHCPSDSDAYRDLELHISGKVVAMATRVPPKNYNGLHDEDSEDQIYVNLMLNEEVLHGGQVFPRDKFAVSSVGSGIPLGTIKGLGTSTEEGTCSVYNSIGIKTHMIMKHRTLMVKHLHWYRVGEKFSICECRCSRARLPPSKFWLFEPRSAMHDVGGWYVETFGRDNKGKTIPDKRCWDGLTVEFEDRRLHPAVYLLALAYRTLDIEKARRRKQTIKDKVEAKVSRLFSWCKKLA